MSSEIARFIQNGRRTGIFVAAAGSFLSIVDVYGIGAVFRVFASDRAALEHFGEAGGASEAAPVE